MAHTCPECGLTCHCNGDIDDLNFGEDCEEADLCEHCDPFSDDEEYDDEAI